MSEDIDKVQELLNNAKLGKITSINFIGSGYVSLAYKISSSDGDFIALLPKDDCIELPNYAYYFSILKTLEEINYKYSPKAVYLNPSQTLIVMTQAPGKSMDWVNDASEDKQKRAVETLIDALLDLRQAPFERCNYYYKRLSGKKLEINTMQKNVNHFMTEWFNMAKAGTPNPMLLKWIKPKVILCEEYARNSKPGRRIVLNHGDTSPGNVLLTSDLTLNLIDWDTSSFSQYPDSWDDYGIAYLFNHSFLFQKHRSFAISLVNKKCNIDISQLDKTIGKSQELIKLCDTMWAIMMNSRVAAGEIDGDSNKLLKIAQQRISEYEAMFTKNSFLTNIE